MLLKNDLVNLAGSTMRILDIDLAKNLVWVFPIADEKALPLPVRLSEITNLTPLTSTIQPDVRKHSPTAVRRANLAWSRIEPLVSNLAIYDYRQRNMLIEARARELKCSPQTLLKDLRRYWCGGQTRAALMGKFHNCGQVSYDNPGSRRGRTPEYGNHDCFLVMSADRKNMDKVIRGCYLKDRTVSVPAAYQRLLEKYYSYFDGNQVRYIKPPGEIPSLRQFRYYLNTHFTLEEILRSRLSDKSFEQNHRARPGYGLQDCHGIGHIYEIDATIADVWLVSSKDRSRIIGKPTLYLIYDKFSRLVVGFYVGLEAPSWPAARHAIISIAENKAELCQKYGVPYDPADWPATGAFPQQFVGDRGEMISRDSSLLSKNMAIIIKNEPALRPDRKGTVECGIYVTQKSMADAVPGYEPPDNPTKRRGKKYDKDACLTLDEIKAVLLTDIIMHNRTVMKQYPLSAEMLSQGVRPIPTEIWSEDLKRRSGSLTRYDEKFVRLSLLPEEKATVTKAGILFRGCYYTCQEVIKRGWLVQAGQRKFTLNVSYDKRLVDSIYIHDDTGDKGYIEATLAPRSADYKGLSFDEVGAYEHMRAALRHEADHINAQERSHFHAVIDPITEHAKKEMRKVSKGKSRASRKKDVAPDRLDERRARRQIEAPINRKPPTPSISADVIALPGRAKDEESATPKASPGSLTDRLRLKRQEMLNG
jgi:hypothetical protein